MPILMPTKSRPQNVKRFFEAYKKTLAVEQVVLLIDDDDKYLPDYMNLGTDFYFYLNKADGIGGLMNLFYEDNPNESYYALIADDVLPETEHWDIILKHGCLETGGITWGADGIQNEGLPTHPFINGNLVRKLGYIAHPKLKHCFIDNCWHIAAKIIGGGYYPNIKMTHMHYLNGKAHMDDTYKNQPSMKDDHDVFDEIYMDYIKTLEGIKNAN